MPHQHSTGFQRVPVENPFRCRSVAVGAFWEDGTSLPQMAAPTYAQVAQGPPSQALSRSTEETHRRQEITRSKRAAEAPQAVGASRTAPRAQAPSSAMSGLQAGQAVPGTLHLSADLRRYVSRLVQQYMSKRIGTLVNAGPATDSPVLDTEMVEEDRLAW